MFKARGGGLLASGKTEGSKELAQHESEEETWGREAKLHKRTMNPMKGMTLKQEGKKSL